MNEGLRKRLSQIKHVALDMDGTIYLSDTLFPYTLPFLGKLDEMGISYTFLTNNPSRCRKDYIDKLCRMGIPAGMDRMYTTIEATIGYIRANLPGVKKMYMLGTPSMVSEFEAAGFVQEEKSPEAVVVSFDMTLTYERLCKASWWIGKGLPYIATNPDRVCPTDLPTILVDCGSICACIESATGRKPDVTLGKPDPQMIYAIARDFGVEASEMAIVGDRLYTDIASGINAGALSVLVLSGETSLPDVNRSGIRPDLICRDLEEFGNLLEDNRIE